MNPIKKTTKNTTKTKKKLRDFYRTAQEYYLLLQKSELQYARKSDGEGRLAKHKIGAQELEHESGLRARKHGGKEITSSEI
jgi:hypothetical protein